RVDIERPCYDLYLHAGHFSQAHRPLLELQTIAGQPLRAETCCHQTLLSCYSEVSTLSREVSLVRCISLFAAVKSGPAEAYMIRGWNSPGQSPTYPAPIPFRGIASVRPAHEKPGASQVASVTRPSRNASSSLRPSRNARHRVPD